jgi:hypothetical protein
VICGLLAFPADADRDVTVVRRLSTFGRATELLASVSGRDDYTGAPEKFENASLLLYEPAGGQSPPAIVRIVNASSGSAIAEADYFRLLRELYNIRNPHNRIG